MKPTNIGHPDYFHKVVDCQWACPAHTPVPEYIRLIASGRYSDAYMINWRSNVFPGILGRVCDRPCEPACRRGRIDKEPVAICRLKRVAADLKDDLSERLPKAPTASQTATMRYDSGRDAGWSSQVARRAHNPEVAGSNPVPATKSVTVVDTISATVTSFYARKTNALQV